MDLQKSRPTETCPQPVKAVCAYFVVAPVPQVPVCWCVYVCMCVCGGGGGEGGITKNDLAFTNSNSSSTPNTKPQLRCDGLPCSVAVSNLEKARNQTVIHLQSA